MYTYICTFQGRKINAIGKFYPITVKIKAISKIKALAKLYLSFEHIAFVDMQENQD